MCSVKYYHSENLSWNTLQRAAFIADHKHILGFTRQICYATQCYKLAKSHKESFFRVNFHEVNDYPFPKKSCQKNVNRIFLRFFNLVCD